MQRESAATERIQFVSQHRRGGSLRSEPVSFSPREDDGLHRSATRPRQRHRMDRSHSVDEIESGKLLLYPPGLSRTLNLTSANARDESPTRERAQSDLQEPEATASHGLSRPLSYPAIDVPQSLLETQSDVFRLIDKALQTRHLVDSEGLAFANCTRFMLESAREYQAVVEADRRGDVGSSSGPLISAYEKLQGDYDALVKQELATRTQRTELSNIEFRLLSKEREASHRLREFLGAAGKDPTTLSLDHSPVVAPQTPTELPSILQQFYYSKGEIGIQAERLQDWSDYFHEQLVERNFREDQGQNLVPSNDEFERIYRQRRQEILNDLQAARSETARLYGECQDAGITVEGTAEHELYGEDGEIFELDTARLAAMPEPIEIIQLPQPLESTSLSGPTALLQTDPLVASASAQEPPSAPFAVLPTGPSDSPASLSAQPIDQAHVVPSRSWVHIDPFSEESISGQAEYTHQSVRDWLSEVVSDGSPSQAAGEPVEEARDLSK